MVNAITAVSEHSLNGARMGKDHQTYTVHTSSQQWQLGRVGSLDVTLKRSTRRGDVVKTGILDNRDSTN